MAQMKAAAEGISYVPNLGMLLLLMAVLPAICEEIAFRGFVLSGLRHIGHKWWAIGFSAIAFGIVHSILQQQIGAAAVGVALGYLAIQTGNLLPCMIFHAIYNGLALAAATLVQDSSEGAIESQYDWLLSGGQMTIFQPWVIAISFVGAGAVLLWLHRLPYQHTKEEQLQEARDRQFSGA